MRTHETATQPPTLTRPLAPRGNEATVKTSAELDLMWEAGQVVGKTHLVLRKTLRPGMTTRDLDAVAEREIRGMGAVPAFMGYHGFPATLCVSVNNEIVHGIPGERVIEEGDVVSLDLGAIVGGLYGDAAISVVAGAATDDLERLLETCEGSLYAGIAQARAGNRIGDISSAVEQHVLSCGAYGIVRGYVGHGIGRQLHEAPSVPNFGRPGRGPAIREGMALAIEPMVNLGGDDTAVLDDGWTVVTADGSPSVHFEHTVLITDGEPIITTRVADE